MRGSLTSTVILTTPGITFASSAVYEILLSLKNFKETQIKNFRRQLQKQTTVQSLFTIVRTRKPNDSAVVAVEHA